MGRAVTFGVKAVPVTEGPGTTLNDLDDGSLGLVLAYLTLQDICALALTCKTLAGAIIRQDAVWRKVLIDVLPFKPYCLPKSAPSSQRWYFVVKHYCTSLRCPSNQVAEAAVIDTEEWTTGGDEATTSSTNLNPLYYRRIAGLRSFFASPDRSCNPIFAWNSSMQLRHGFILRADPATAASPDPHGGGGRRRVAAAVVRRTFPFSHTGTALVGAPSVRYIELEVLQLPESARVNIGVVLDRTHMHWMRADVPAGHFSGTWRGALKGVAWGACEGRIYPGPTDTQWHARGAPFSPPVHAPGTVLGCGMDILSNTLFFTCDGAVVGTAHPAGHASAADNRTAAGNEGGGAAWSDSGSEGAPGGQDRFLESLMSLRRSAKSFGLDTAGTDFPAETPQHTMHALDVAHSMFALSLQGGATVRVNLGQTPFRFDIGAALAAPRSAGLRGAAADDDDDRASVASSAGALSLGGASGRAWRAAIAGETAHSRESGSTSSRSDGGDTVAAAGGGGLAAVDRIAVRLRELARNWSARSYGSEVDEDVRTALWRLGSDLGRRESSVVGPGGLQGVLAWLGIAGSAQE